MPGRARVSTCTSGSLRAAEIERYVVRELAAIGRDEAVIAETQVRMAQVDTYLDEARASHLDEADLRSALADFVGLWSTMTPDQRARTLHVPIERVSYDGPKGEIAITFRPVGIRALAGEAR